MLPDAAPPGIRRLLRRCLEKDPKRRLHDIADALIEIDDPAGGVSFEPSVAQAPKSRDRLAWSLVGILAIASAGALVWGYSQSDPDDGP